MERAKDEADRRDAYHEAGHAVLGEAQKAILSRHLAGVCIRRSNGCRGMTKYAGRFKADECSPAQVKAYLIGCWGGYAAEVVCCSADGDTPGRCSDDLSDALPWAEWAAHGCPQNMDACLCEAKSDAVAMVTRYRRSVEAVAERLLGEGELSGAQVRQIVAAVGELTFPA